MTSKSMLFTLVLATATAGAGVAAAADSNDGLKNPPDRAMRHNAPDKGLRQGEMMGNGMMGNGMMGNGMMGNGMMGNGMMGNGMMGNGMMGGRGGGMMGMMDGCAQMMGASTTAHLPPGNEKLELKMQAEIMQKTGEILGKYADQLGADAKRTP